MLPSASVECGICIWRSEREGWLTESVGQDCAELTLNRPQTGHTSHVISAFHVAPAPASSSPPGSWRVLTQCLPCPSLLYPPSSHDPVALFWVINLAQPPGLLGS